MTAGQLDAGADYTRNRNRTAMIDASLIKGERSKIIWESSRLPNDAVAVSAALFKDKAFVQRLQAALAQVSPLLATQGSLLPANDTGFVSSDNTFNKPIRDAGLATAIWAPSEMP